MPSDIEEDLIRQLDSLTAELDRRAARHNELRPYARRCAEARMATPPAVTRAKMTRAYDSLMAMAGTPWGKLVIASKLDRLEVAGFETGTPELDKRISEEIWQPNAMDLESKLGHRASLHDGRSHALCWPGNDDLPEITLDDATQMVVQFREGSRRVREAALRRWQDDRGRDEVTLYRPDGLFKFRKRADTESVQVEGSDWVRREVEGEEWPLPNPFNVVPVVELAVNRELAPGRFTDVRGEFEDEVGLIDRINLLTFLGLVVAIWMGFPLRGVVGDKILRDDDNKPLPPFESRPDSVVQFENPEAKLVQLDPADRSGLSIFDELAQLASSTTTPRHHFPMSSSVSNVGADLIRAFEGGMNATINGSHKPSLGEGWESLVALAGLMLPDPIEVPRTTEAKWIDHQSRTLGEQADAFLKLRQGDLPWVAAADIALNASQDTIRRWAEEVAVEVAADDEGSDDDADAGLPPAA